MAAYWRILTIASVAETHRLFQEAIVLARRRDQAAARAGRGVSGATERELKRAYGVWQRGLDEIARATATKADDYIRRELARTAVRPDTRTAPHLRNLIRSRALRPTAFSTGQVGIADIAWLDKAVNPRTPGYGPYWEAQEEGTGTAAVRSQLGRVIRGYFYGPGGTNPLTPQDPPPTPLQPIFVPGRPVSFGGARMRGGIGPRGGSGGFGTIKREIRGRHFLEHGSDLAEVSWRTAVRQNEALALVELSAVLGASAVPGFARAARSRRR